MTERVSIFVEGAPVSFGHFSQVIKYGNAVHVSGQLPIDSETNKLVSSDPAEQARSILQHLTASMQATSGQLSNILSTRLYLIDLKDHGAFDKVSRDFFFFTPPARTVLQVSALPFGARMMLDAIAELNPMDLKPTGII